MNIAFYANHKKWGGLANNGGTRTILKSAHALRKLGHRVDVVARSNKFTWFNIPDPVRKVPKDTDIIIAVSFSDAADVVAKCSPDIKRAWWMRGWESWRVDSESDIYKVARKLPVITNGSRLCSLLANRNIDSYLCYAGLDLDKWFRVPLESSSKTRIGCLYNTKHPTKRWDVFESMVDVMGFKSCEYVAFGTEKCHCHWLRKYLRNPSHEQLRELYSSCDIWVAPTENEGFHNVPAEAALCGCLIMANRMPSNGMDYATEETAILFDKPKEIYSAVVRPDRSKVSKMQDYIVNKIGTREANMKKFVTILESL